MSHPWTTLFKHRTRKRKRHISFPSLHIIITSPPSSFLLIGSQNKKKNYLKQLISGSRQSGNGHHPRSITMSTTTRLWLPPGLITTESFDCVSYLIWKSDPTSPLNMDQELTSIKTNLTNSFSYSNQFCKDTYSSYTLQPQQVINTYLHRNIINQLI